MKIKILGETDYQIYPITNDMIDLDEETIKQIGKTKCFKNGEIVDYIPENNEKRELLIVDKKNRLTELTKDFVQVQAGLIVPNIEEKKQEFQTLLNEVRVLQGKTEREILTKPERVEEDKKEVVPFKQITIEDVLRNENDGTI